MPQPDALLDLATATALALRVRKLYNGLEVQHHGGAWSKTEDMIGLTRDVGELGTTTNTRHPRTRV